MNGLVAAAIGLTLGALLCAPGPAGAQSATFTPSDEKPEDYPPVPDARIRSTPARRATASRSWAQQGQTRRQWDDTLDWMTQRHNMPAPRDNDRKAMLDYLEAAFPPRTAPRGWQNRFEKP